HTAGDAPVSLPGVEELIGGDDGGVGHWRISGARVGRSSYRGRRGSGRLHEPNRDRARRMLIRIRRDLDAQPEPGPWIAAARTLSERLIISFDALYYFAD